MSITICLLQVGMHPSAQPCVSLGCASTQNAQPCHLIRLHPSSIHAGKYL
uniref:Uncharacterized protein n=1 Tax=Arundo donax TaxID=35708 RepID=A0A0A9B243_ARUDO